MAIAFSAAAENFSDFARGRFLPTLRQGPIDVVETDPHSSPDSLWRRHGLRLRRW
jgi:hypothetical protein